MGRRHLAIVLLSLACERSSPRASRADASRGVTPLRDATLHSDIPSSFDASARSDAALLQRPDAGWRRSRPTRPARARAGVEGAATLVATTTGGLWIRAALSERDHSTEVIATAIDANGRLQGEGRLLRRTSGYIESLSASVAGEHLSVSWIAHLDDREHARTEHLTVSLHARADLTAVDEPVTLLDERRRCARDCEYGCWPDETIRTFARRDGGALSQC